MIVADTNVITYLLLDGTHTASVEKLYAYDPKWVAPASWRFEMSNVLSTYCRKGSMSIEKATEILGEATQRVASLNRQPTDADVLRASVVYNISGYDAVFVAAAVVNDLPLVTFDGELLKKCPQHAVASHDVEKWFDDRSKRRGDK